MICDECGDKKDDIPRRGLCKRCWAHRRLYHGWRSKYVDAAPVRAHLLILQAANLGTRRIAELSGVNRKQIVWILHGRTERGTPPSRHILAVNAQKLLAIPLPTERHELPADSAPILAIGTTRRMQALVAMGYTQHYIAERMGIDSSRSLSLFHGLRTCVSARRARVVAQLYDELSVTPPPASRWAQRSRERARALGWADPFAWDDEDLDDPDAKPAPQANHEKPQTRQELYDELVELGYTKKRIAEKLDITYPQLLKWLDMQARRRERRNKAAESCCEEAAGEAVDTA